MADEEVRVLPVRRTFDLATIFGITGAFALIAIAIVLGGSPSSFLNIQSVLIVLGGTLAVTTICFSISEIVRTTSVVGKTLLKNVRESKDAAIQVLQISYLARRHGVLSLQDILDRLKTEPFLYKGISMVVDGLPAAEVETILRRDLQATVLRHERSVSVLKRASEFSPAMGLIGTLIGLVQMLGNLDDPTTIGPSMAVALLTTFYGALMANLVFTPLAAKLERNSVLEETINNIYLLGTSSVSRQENPRRLEMLLNSSLRPDDRIRFFE